MSKGAAPDAGVIFTPIVRKHVGTRRKRAAVRVATTASNCPYDASNKGMIPCRCSNRCDLNTPCEKCHHKIFFGASKAVVLGCFIPLPLQEHIAPLLAQLDGDTQIVSIMVDLKEDGEDSMLGEIETLLAIDKIDPKGVFTSKLIFQQKLPFDANDSSMQIVSSNLQQQGKSNPLNPNELKLLHRLRWWVQKQCNLYCMYMVYAGFDMEHELPASINKTSVYNAYRELLLNYSKLSVQGICHLDMHRNNVTWGFNSKKQLAFKLIDFGYNKVYTETGEPPMDVTKHFMRVCDVVNEGLRVFHPVEYPMFHLCASLLLHPIFVPDRLWDKKKHDAKVELMRMFTKQTTKAQLVACKWGPVIYNAALPNSADELFGLWRGIWDTYAIIDDLLLSKWKRVCNIVEAEIAKVYFEPRGNRIPIAHYPTGLAETSHNFTDTSDYMDLFVVFRGKFYECDALDLRVINAEFDLFSMGMMMLDEFSDTDTAWRFVIKYRLLSSTYNKTTRRKILETNVAIQQLCALNFMST